MISLRHNFLFIHIPKTAGNSIQNILRNYSEDRIACLAPHQDGYERFEVRSDRFDIHKHSTLQEYRSRLTPERFAQIFKFTCVRNPWERAISYYFSPHRGPVRWDGNQFIGFLPEISPVTTHIALPGKANHFQNIDFLLRFENLNADFRELCAQIGLPWTPPPLRNKSNKQHYTAYYDEELIAIVRNRYQEEIDHYGYVYASRS